MGQVIHISERLADHSRPSCGGAAFFFALGSPQSYLAGERVERALGEVGWEPLLTDPAALAASRAAAYASDHGRGGRFAVAAARLIFCGSWDVCDPRVIREAAAAAGLDARAALDASQGEVYDLRLHATTRGVLGHAGDELPVVRIGRRWFSGPGAVAAAAQYHASLQVAVHS